MLGQTKQLLRLTPKMVAESNFNYYIYSITQNEMILKMVKKKNIPSYDCNITNHYGVGLSLLNKFR